MGMFMGVGAQLLESDEKDDLVSRVYAETGLLPIEIDDAEKVEMLMAIHFPLERFRCSYCVDHIDGLCEGMGLKGYKAVKRCMSQKAKNGEMEIYY